MFAIIELGAKQFKIQKDQIFTAELTGKEPGSSFEAKVLLLADNNKVNIGSPAVSQAKVTLKVLEAVKADKIQGFKYKRRKNYKRSWGHRQSLQKLQVVSIQG